MEKLILSLILLLTFASSAWSAPHNLDEIFTRKDRQATAVFYSGEDSYNHFLWQPMTLCFEDIFTGHEVWRMTSTSDIASGGNVYFADMNGSIWSADGKRLAFYSFGLESQSFDKGGADRLWFLVDTDGSSLRPIINGPTREQWDSKFPYFHWDPSHPDTYFEFGSTAAGNIHVENNILYRAKVTDTDVSIEPWVTLPSGSLYAIDHGISSTGDKVLIHTLAEDQLYFATLFPEESRGLIFPGGISSNRPHSSYWGDTPEDIKGWHGHGLWLLGDGTWFSGMPSGSSSHWRFKVNGTAQDGSSNYLHDFSFPYDFGGEAEPVNTRTGTNQGSDPWCDASPDAGYDCANYMSHMTFDRWGSKVIYSNSKNEPIGAAVYDIDSHVFNVKSFGISTDYHDWSAWSDFNISLDVGSKIFIQKYDDPTSATPIAYTYGGLNGGNPYSPYVNKEDPVQSPDGTKVGFNSEFLNKSPDANDIFWVVAYYPYPPEITGISNVEGSIVVQFDWRLDQAQPRGYTKRGWPSEDANLPPPPREIKSFRLWRSPDLVSWTQIDSVNHDIFSRFDFVHGKFKAGEPKFWEITDEPKQGTWYYAVTSREFSGLESRTLSNIFQVKVGADGELISTKPFRTYPEEPGQISPFYFQKPPAPSNVSITKGAHDGQNIISWSEPPGRYHDLIRYYNIYYSSKQIPEIDQKFRIASVPKGTTTFVDWLAEANADGFYRITSVDTQGNEGSQPAPSPPSGLLKSEE